MTRLRVWIHTLGCDKNLVDSEALLGRFLAAGFAAAAGPEDADVWLVNTCGFIDAARRDSRAAVRELARAKGQRRLIVTGCWAQEHAAEIEAAFPAVDLVGGVGEFDAVVAACAAGRGGRVLAPPSSARYSGLAERPLLTPGHVAFLKVAEGCDCRCSFCRIPSLRGRLRSRPPSEIEAEARRLAAGGVQELQVVAQNVSDYGRDLGTDLVALVRRLDRIEGLRWIRLLYLYPGRLSLAEALRLLQMERVAPYLDLPIQHASPPLLRAMRRPGGGRAGARWFERLRAERPDLVLRSTVLLGFPGEREEDVEILADFLARVEFDHLGTYRYSPEAGTPAAALPDRPHPEEVADRESRILDLQAEISLRRQRTRLGRSWEVVVDELAPAARLGDLLGALAEGESASGPIPDGAAVPGAAAPGTIALGRSFHFGYDLDGVVAMPAGTLRPGERCRARFQAVTPFDVWAAPDAGRPQGGPS